MAVASIGARVWGGGRAFHVLLRPSLPLAMAATAAPARAIRSGALVPTFGVPMQELTVVVDAAEVAVSASGAGTGGVAARFGAPGLVACIWRLRLAAMVAGDGSRQQLSACGGGMHVAESSPALCAAQSERVAANIAMWLLCVASASMPPLKGHLWGDRTVATILVADKGSRGLLGQKPWLQ